MIQLAGRMSRAFGAFRAHSCHSGGCKRAVRSYSKGASSSGTNKLSTTSRIPVLSGGQEDCSRTDRTAQVNQPMEVEIKLRLPDEAAYKKVEQLIAPGLKATYLQENYFFDGPGQELNSRRVVLRVRLYDKDRKALLTLKGEQILKDGIGSASEVEEPLDPAVARRFLDQPSSLLQLDSTLMQGVAKQYNMTEMVCLGGFSNIRKEAEWRSHLLELDQTQYPWGTLYELECETDKPEALKAELEEVLKGAGVEYSYSKNSKFANFINKTLL